jgi:hypothetical protein
VDEGTAAVLTVLNLCAASCSDNEGAAAVLTVLNLCAASCSDNEGAAERPIRRHKNYKQW